MSKNSSKAFGISLNTRTHTLFNSFLKESEVDKSICIRGVKNMSSNLYETTPEDILHCSDCVREFYLYSTVVH